MCPQVAELRFWSIGPKDPMPIAATGPSRSKNAIARPIVSSGVDVGIVSVARRSSGPLPTAHSHFEPPVSIPPYTLTGEPSDFRGVDRSLQTAARAEPVRPVGDIASDVSRVHGHGAAGTADDELRRKDDHAGPLRGSSGDPVKEELGAETAECLGRLRHDGEERIEPRGVLDVVEAHERDVVRYLEVRGSYRFDRAERDEVVDREDRRWRTFQLAQLPHAVAPALRIDGRADDELAGDGESGALERVHVAAMPISRRRHLVRLHDKPDSRVAERDDVLDEAPGASGVVPDDDVAVDSGDSSIDEHELHAELVQAQEVVSRAVADRRNRDPLDTVRDQLLDHFSLQCEVRSGVAKEHAVAGAAGHVFGPADDQREEGVCDVRDDQRKRPCLLADQAAGEPARNIAELGDRLLDPLARLGTYAFTAVDDAGDRHG